MHHTDPSAYATGTFTLSQCVTGVRHAPSTLHYWEKTTIILPLFFLQISQKIEEEYASNFPGGSQSASRAPHPPLLGIRYSLIERCATTSESLYESLYRVQRYNMLYDGYNK